jgi:hypothetical protein
MRLLCFLLTEKLVFASNRQGEKQHETNVFIADWVDSDPAELVNEDNLKKHIYYLASDELKGRLTGSEGETKAANYLSSEFKKLGLKPYAGKDFIQNFEYDVKLNPHDDQSSVKLMVKM